MILWLSRHVENLTVKIDLCRQLFGPITTAPLTRSEKNVLYTFFCTYTTPFVSLIMRGKLHSSVQTACVRSSMLHGSETWPVRKENVVALQRAEMRLVRWMCGVKLKDRLPSKELSERLGIDDIAFVLQQNRLRWYGHVLRQKDDDWVQKCMEYEVEGPRPRG